MTLFMAMESKESDGFFGFFVAVFVGFILVAALFLSLGLWPTYWAIALALAGMFAIWMKQTDRIALEKRSKYKTVQEIPLVLKMAGVALFSVLWVVLDAGTYAIFHGLFGWSMKLDSIQDNSSLRARDRVRPHLFPAMGF